MKLLDLLFLGLAASKTITDLNELGTAGRIIGGYEVSPKYKYPWMVSLLYFYESKCGGTLYNSNTVISASHCVIGNNERWLASLHRHYIKKEPELEGGKDYNVLDRITHPSYHPFTHSYDVAIWKIEDTGYTAATVQLDQGSLSDNVDSLLTIIGWGSTCYGGDASLVLMETQLPIFNLTHCQSIYPDLDSVSQFCAGKPEGGLDSCQGDSGGPIFKVSNNETTLVGIVSWGEGCGSEGYPGVYTRISKVIDFIQSHTMDKVTKLFQSHLTSYHD